MSTKSTSPLDRVMEGYQSPQEFAAVVGVNRERIERLYLDGRIVGATKWRGKILIPKDAEVLPGKLRKGRREGPLSVYMHDWDFRHGRVEPEKPKWDEDLDLDDLFI